MDVFASKNIIQGIIMRSYIKIILIYVLRVIMRALFIFPIKKNRIVFNAYSGRQYSCNPKYISEFLIKNFPDKYEIIWAFNEPNKYKDLEQFGIKIVKYNSLIRFYYEATSQISVNNIGSFSWFPIRKGQEHVNTWHGSAALKKCGTQEIANNFAMKKSIELSSRNTTLMISTSQTYTDCLCRKDLKYFGKVLQSGYPRNDLFFENLNVKYHYFRRKLSINFSIPIDSYMVLYAPTWRYDNDKEIKHPNFERVINILRKSRNREVVILSRLHHLSDYSIDGVQSVIDVTDYKDMQELLCASDFLITDYSSSIWDFSLTMRPIILYAPDLRKYVHERGFHHNIYEWGFPVCENDTDFEKVLAEMSAAVGKNNAVEFLEKNNSFETGKACEIVGNWIDEICK